MKTKIINILINPFFLAFIISSVIIYFLPPVFDKYKAELSEKIKNTDFKVHYFDLDNDNFSEQIKIFPDFTNRIAIIVYTKGRLLNQWNFSGDLSGIDHIIYGDFDDNNLNEIYVVTFNNDSIFLNCFEPLNMNGTSLTNKFISKYRLTNNEVTFSMHSLDMMDINDDGFKEFLFSINTGFSLQPRNLFAYNIISDTVYKSPKSGSLLYSLIAFDLNNDNNNEIITGENFATGNFNEEFPYNDHCCWLMVFNRKLEFFFKPVKIGSYSSVIDVLPYKPNNITYLAVLHKYPGMLDIPSSLCLYNINGELLKEKKINNLKQIKFSYLVSNNEISRDKLYLIQGNGIIEEIDSNLTVIKKDIIEGIVDGKPFAIADFDNDGENEFLFWGNNKQKLLLTRNDFSNPVVLDIPNNMKGVDYSIVLKGKENPDIFIQCDEYSYLFKYYKNPLYYFKYIIYIGIYTGVLLFILLLNKIQKHRIKQRYETEKKLAELQLRSIKNQTDPHFALNIINSIGSLYHKREIDLANYVFGKYAKMLRSTLLSSDRIIVSISSEIDYVENYLQLEKFRLENKFEYYINIRDNIDTDVKIPKMLIHTFAENAVKHGLRHLDSNGKLAISIEPDGNRYLIHIKDNGIGRINAKKHSEFSTGKGLKILDQVIDLYYGLRKIRISYEITDLYDNLDNPIGTNVRITIPVKN